MSGLDRLTSGAGRLLSRMADFRQRAEEQRERRDHERGLPTEEERAQPVPPAAPSPSEQPPAPATVIPWGLRVASEAGWRLLVLAGVVWVLIQVIGAISLLIIAFSAGLLITALLQPTVARLRRWGLGRGLATAATFISGFAVMGLIGWFVVWQVIENQEDLTRQVQDGIDELRNWILNSPFQVTEDQLNDSVDTINQWIGEHSQELTSAGLQGASYIVTFFTGAALTAFVCLFLLYDGRRIWQWFLKFVPLAAREGVAGAGPRAWVTLTGYVRGTVIVAFIDAIGIGLGIWVLGVPLAVPLGVIVFLSAFVPVVGALASGALAVVVAFVTNGLVTALLVLGVVLLVQQIEGNVLQPLILGRMVQVHPLAVVLTVTGGSLLAGIPGAVLAVPLVAVTNTVVTYLRAYAESRSAQPRAVSGSTALGLSPAVPPSMPGAKEPPSGAVDATQAVARELARAERAAAGAPEEPGGAAGEPEPPPGRGEADGGRRP
ncbi:AI-2E family transporter [Streptomyces sp. TRM 70351]|uniref:AI-2E family transporter n=1 Tax=Streptomyces sp. TRM 70351 TaxID=3116552 RepID=UPI002E7B456E|nr:AI-2E family transporter [Streptomyces sp. TRM 70351]MEE1927788.1 AI-2E family transporter [Streptomyces sp. TRM 70351]